MNPAWFLYISTSLSIFSIYLLLTQTGRVKLKKGPVWFLIALGLLLRIFFSADLVTYDEVMHISNIGSFGGRNLENLQGLKGGVMPWYPVFYIVSAPLDMLTKNPWATARIMNLLFGSLSIYLIYLVGLELKNEYAGLSGALLLSFLPVHINYSGTSVLGISSVFFFLLSYLLVLKKDIYAPVALSVFTLIRPESFIFSTIVFLFHHDDLFKRNMKYTLFLMFVIGFCAANSISYGLVDYKWSLSVTEASVNFWSRLLSEAKYFVENKAFFLFVTLLGLYQFRKQKELATLFVLSFLIFGLYKLSVFGNLEQISRYALFPSLFMLMLASSFFSDKKILLIALMFFAVFAPGALFASKNSKNSELFDALKKLESDVKLHNTDLPLVSNFYNLIKLEFPNQSVNYWEVVSKPEMNLPKHFLVSKTNLVDNPLDLETFEACKILDSWNYSLKHRKLVSFYEFNCTE